MEDRSAASRKRLQKVYMVMYEPTRARLRAVATLEGISMVDLLDTVVGDYLRGWEKLHKSKLDRLPNVPRERVAARTTKEQRSAGKRRVKKD